MKKGIFIGLLIIAFVVLMNLYPQGRVEGNELTMEQKYPFYKKENEQRYQQYQQQYPNLADLDIITRVNLNLDQPFYTNTKEAKNLNSNLVFVNKYHYLREDYVPEQLEEIQSCAHGARLLVSEARKQFEQLCADATKENLQIRVISSYRSYAYQKSLYDKYVMQDGVVKADTYSARPGFSEHQTGLVVDLDNIVSGFENFENTKEFEWMEKNAYKYGFILRYPKGKEDITGYDYEAWHYRYVGKDVALILHDNQLTFDEYYVRFVEK